MVSPRQFLSGLLEKSPGAGLAGALTVGLLAITPVAHAEPAAPQAVPPAVTKPAQSAAVTKPAPPVAKSEMDTFRKFLRTHPRVARDIRKDPSLVHNPEFLAKHTGLQKFLTAHPTVQEELKQNPTAFLPLTKQEHKQTAVR